MPQLATNLNNNNPSTPVSITGPCTVHTVGLPPGKKIRLMIRRGSSDAPHPAGVFSTLRGGPVVVDVVGTYHLSVRGINLESTDSVTVEADQ